ncbi:transketolase family protein [Helicobacter didelphidarum]|uniref:transketolase family protein n=1 Tax=Helicobacter didelphidarum TaxID=2040648 RepID=UPI001FEB7A24|nr:transketolase [Helicobacter didelphidarum]
MNLQQISNELRMLCADMVQVANSGHPGAPMGLADIAIVLAKHIIINPKESSWINRDRLVFSGGHASALLYSMLHLWGYDINLQDLKNFRKLDSKTPGHPEYLHTHGVEITTGPLGQGIANAVGFAMASKRASYLLGKGIINHKVYCFCGDGDLEEGISYEACSLAGLHRLSNLVLLYDSNNISIEGNVDIAFNEKIRMRFESQGFYVQEIDGHDFQVIESALQNISNSQPNIIVATTKIAKNAYKLEGSHNAHGAPLGEEIIAKTKENLGLGQEKFFISEDLLSYFRENAKKGEQKYLAWQKNLESCVISPQILESLGLDSKQEYKAKDLLRLLLQKDFSEVLYPTFMQQRGEYKNATLNYKDSIATRSSNGKILNAIAKANPGFIGGSADLAPSNNTAIMHSGDFPCGVNLHFGVREHAMGAISNAFANYGIFIPYCATFFVFSDYLCPSIRVASLMNAQVFYIFTHDSIGVGEDGATHQPVEQLSHLRAMPNLLNWRVADANENLFAWQNALSIKKPQSFILTRQNLPLIESSHSTKENVAKGGYVISSSKLDSTNPSLTLVASGSEVSLAIEAQIILEDLGSNIDWLLESLEDLQSYMSYDSNDMESRQNNQIIKNKGIALTKDSLTSFLGNKKGISTQVVSLPCFELFCQQNGLYYQEVFKDSKVLGIEALRGLELYTFCDEVITMQGFGASGKGDLLFKRFGFSKENVILQALNLLKNNICL